MTSGRDLLQFGAGGLKLGNLGGVDRTSQDYGGPIGPSEPLVDLIKSTITPAQRGPDPSASVLRGCDKGTEASVEDLLTDFVDDLFPMAQGVPEAPAVSYCLRFAVELAKLKALEAWSLRGAGGEDPGSVLEMILVQQRAATLWQRRCGSQLQLVSMCGALDLFHPNQNMLVLPYPCTRWNVIPSSAVEIYLTPQCLLSVNGTFYDPCECMPSACPPSSDPTTQVPFSFSADMFLGESPNCTLSLDPRRIARTMEMGWWSKDSGGDGNDALRAQANAWLATPANLLYLDVLTGSALDPSSTLGNPAAGFHWTSAEGLLSESGLYCDMIADYWPDDAVFPVGYHVTVPCMASDTSFRSFDNVFAMDDDGDLVYMEDQTRDMDKVDSHFGAGGLCRASNFGFNMYATNTMRVCTRVRSDDDDVDIHVPTPLAKAGYYFEDEVCGADASDLPWGVDESNGHDIYDPLMFYVGTVPVFPDADASRYPDTDATAYVIGPVQLMTGEGWGDGCEDFQLPRCTESSTDCAPGFNCMQVSMGVWEGGVCVLRCCISDILFGCLAGRMYAPPGGVCESLGMPL